MSAIPRILGNSDFWLALAFIGVAGILMAFGMTYLPTNAMLAWGLIITAMVFAGVSTTLFVVTGVSAARKARKRASEYL